jgi:cation diffusion facilitator family transporter
MHAESLDSWRHEHVFLGEHHARNERRSWAVVALCGMMMVAEIVGGWLWGSMALIADGLHMSTHAGALVIAAFAYAYARRHARDERFTFGTGKLGDLAAFASAIVLAAIALLIGYESVARLLQPVPIAFDEAIPLAALGLGVNLLSAWLLHDDHGHAGDAAHEHAHDGEPHHHHHSHDDRPSSVCGRARGAISRNRRRRSARSAHNSWVCATTTRQSKTARACAAAAAPICRRNSGSAISAA